MSTTNSEQKIELPEVLIIEDSPSLARCYTEYLSSEECRVTIASNGVEALEIMAKRAPPVVLLDLRLPDMDGLDIIAKNRNSAMIVITAQGSTSLAVESMRAGAFDYLEKPFHRDRLSLTVRNALDRQKLAGRIIGVDGGFLSGFCDFIGTSPAMQGVYRIIESAAVSKATVFITGESGTGKEVCAMAIHERSNRKDKAFVPINCAAIPENLMESEIFGHTKGAFTGAHAVREGAAARADGGTLFLDEIGEMDLDLQSKLLRFIQTGTYQKVGSNKLESVDVRFVCATNRDPLEQVRKGEFREDLYYRLHVIPIELPALRERGKDVIDIARHFLQKYNEEELKEFYSFSLETEAIFQNYTWPGNIRQLQNIVRNIVVLNNGTEVTPKMLPPPLNGKPIEPNNHPHARSSDSAVYVDIDNLRAANHSGYERRASDRGSPQNAFNNSVALNVINKMLQEKLQFIESEDNIRELWQIEMEAIENAIKACGDNIPRAAKKLGVSPSTLYRKIQAWKDAGQSPQ